MLNEGRIANLKATNVFCKNVNMFWWLTLSDMGGGTMCPDESKILFVAYSVLKCVKFCHDFS